jgi:hypothetical protein
LFPSASKSSRLWALRLLVVAQGLRDLGCVGTCAEPIYSQQLVRPFMGAHARYPQLPCRFLELGDDPGEDVRVPVRQGPQFVQHLADLVGDEDLGLRAAQAIALGTFEVLELAAFRATRAQRAS